MLLLRKPSDDELRRILAASARADVTYEEVGATRNGEPPAGYRFDHYERQIGTGEDLFESTIEALRDWLSHTDAGVELVPSGARVDDGTTVLFVLRAFGLWTVAPCRVVYVSAEPSRFRFGYGTLPGHPERGEVALTVSLDENGTVAACVDSFSETVDPLARAALPLTRIVQKRTTVRYLEALAAAAKDG